MPQPRLRHYDRLHLASTFNTLSKYLLLLKYKSYCRTFTFLYIYFYSYLSQMFEHFLPHWLSERNVRILCYCLCWQHKRPMLWWRRENVNLRNTNVKVIWFSTALHPSSQFCLWECWLLIGLLQRLVGGTPSARQLPGTVETTGGDCIPKPLCWKWPNPDTLGGDEHGTFVS